ncbi:gp31 [Listeria phage P40]|uniref:DNA polymerase n=1 Tax=Listeria phage P40 TaxID=560178 RepID=UPI00018198E5|nr:DNA polymerase [Listeria phage P40]ACI00391.1 gp31 [Listeria phage P40]
MCPKREVISDLSYMKGDITLKNILRARPLAFYDIEVFHKYNLIVVKDINKNIIVEMEDDFSPMVDIVKNYTLIGVNNHYYDDLVITTGITSLDNPDFNTLIKNANDRIIVDRDKWKTLDIIDSLDALQQLDMGFGLKMFEANRGVSIEETQVDFNITRELTEKEKEATRFYCRHDVDNTIDMFRCREGDYFTSKNILLNLLDKEGKLPQYGDTVSLYSTKQWKTKNNNTTSLSAKLIMGRDRNNQWSRIRLNGENDKDRTLELLNTIPDKARQHLTRNDNLPRDAKGKTKLDLQRGGSTCTIYKFGCKIEFSDGGLHGVPWQYTEEEIVEKEGLKGKKGVVGRKSNGRFENVILLDVASMYPRSIQILQALGDKTSKLDELIEMRLEAKHNGDKTLANALKLVINSVYGLLKAPTSLFYNPNASMSVCALGQIQLYRLCEMLYNGGYTLVNINTDGVGFVSDTGDYETYKKIWHEWEEMTGYTLEEDSFDDFIQKDVNNYIAIKDGKIKVKGKDVNKYKSNDRIFDPDFYKNPTPVIFKNNTMSIVDEMIVEQLINGTPFLDTMLANLKHPTKFQIILKAGSTYEGTFDEDGNKYNKINRVFATHENHPNAVTLYKRKEGQPNNRFPDSPQHMLILNQDLRDVKLTPAMINLKFYAEIAEKRLKAWVK